MKKKTERRYLEISIMTHSMPSEEHATYAVFEKAGLASNKKGPGLGGVTGFCMGRINPEKKEVPEFQIVAAGDSTMTFVIDLGSLLDNQDTPDED
jgi:hypothetical protein